jgi:hypothetical protein
MRKKSYCHADDEKEEKAEEVLMVAARASRVMLSNIHLASSPNARFWTYATRVEMTSSLGQESRSCWPT